jgi:hypothetical protein
MLELDGGTTVVLKRTLRQRNAEETLGGLLGDREMARSPNRRTNSMRAES